MLIDDDVRTLSQIAAVFCSRYDIFLELVVGDLLGAYLFLKCPGLNGNPKRVATAWVCCVVWADCGDAGADYSAPVRWNIRLRRQTAKVPHLIF